MTFRAFSCDSKQRCSRIRSTGPSCKCFTIVNYQLENCLQLVQAPQRFGSSCGSVGRAVDIRYQRYVVRIQSSAKIYYLLPNCWKDILIYNHRSFIRLVTDVSLMTWRFIYKIHWCFQAMFFQHLNCELQCRQSNINYLHIYVFIVLLWWFEKEFFCLFRFGYSLKVYYIVSFWGHLFKTNLLKSRAVVVVVKWSSC